MLYSNNGISKFFTKVLELIKPCLDPKEHYDKKAFMIFDFGGTKLDNSTVEIEETEKLRSIEDLVNEFGDGQTIYVHNVTNYQVQGVTKDFKPKLGLLF